MYTTFRRPAQVPAPVAAIDESTIFTAFTATLSAMRKREDAHGRYLALLPLWQTAQALIGPRWESFRTCVAELARLVANPDYDVSWAV